MTEGKARPMLFSGPMVRALRRGGKTQTRRVVKGDAGERCPYGKAGDLLWVKETWRFDEQQARVLYRAECDGDSPGVRWKSALFMPRSASRLTLRIRETRAERLQEISEADAMAEGVGLSHDAVEVYRNVWDALNGKTYPWSSNPWVWVVSFEVVETGVGSGD